jgi:hypothetical protein
MRLLTDLTAAALCVWACVFVAAPFVHWLRYWLGA